MAFTVGEWTVTEVAGTYEIPSRYEWDCGDCNTLHGKDFCVEDMQTGEKARIFMGSTPPDVPGTVLEMADWFEANKNSIYGADASYEYLHTVFSLCCLVRQK